MKKDERSCADCYWGETGTCGGNYRTTAQRCLIFKRRQLNCSECDWSQAAPDCFLLQSEGPDHCPACSLDEAHLGPPHKQRPGMRLIMRELTPGHPGWKRVDDKEA